jgi:DNA-binding transcriptional regulator YhcF (GntR family)
MSDNVQIKLKPSARRVKAIDRRAQGWSYEKIAVELKVNEKTIRRDLKSSQVQDFVDELQRRQIADIEAEEKSYVRMQFRDKILDRLQPRKVEQTVQAEIKQEVRHGVSDEQLAKFIPVIADMVMGEQTHRTDKEDTGPPEEPMDTSNPNP